MYFAVSLAILKMCVMCSSASLNSSRVCACFHIVLMPRKMCVCRQGCACVSVSLFLCYSVNIHVCVCLSCHVALCVSVSADLRPLTRTPPLCGPGDSDGNLLTEYMALTIRVAVETSAVSSSRLWVSLLTVSTLMSGLPRVTPRRPGTKTKLWSYSGSLPKWIRKKVPKPKKKPHFILNDNFLQTFLFHFFLLCFSHYLFVVIGGFRNLAGWQAQEQEGGLEFCRLQYSSSETETSGI